MNLLYNLGIRAYSMAVHLAAGSNPKAQKMLVGQAQTVDKLSQLHLSVNQGRDAFTVWFHAASLGEFEQARPMIELLKKEHPDWKVLLTFFSPSGYEVRKNYDQADVVAYLPFDTPSWVRKFLDTANIDVAIFIKYEFWGNYLSELKKRGIPTYLISGIFRPDHIFFRPYRGIMGNVLKCFTHLFVQDENSRRLLGKVGVKQVTVAGDTRMDRVTDILQKTADLPEIEEWLKKDKDGKDKTFIFGSSWPADEDTYLPWLKSRTDIRAIIAPHEFDDDRLKSLKRRLGVEETVLLSELRIALKNGKHPKYVIIDCFGKLASLYRYGDIAYIGGGFGHGIHNINEAAVYGIPVIFGPRHSKFREAIGLIEANGGFSVSDKESFSSTATTLLSSDKTLKDAGDAAAKFIKSNLGATRKIYDQIFH